MVTNSRRRLLHPLRFQAEQTSLVAICHCFVGFYFNCVAFLGSHLYDQWSVIQLSPLHRLEALTPVSPSVPRYLYSQPRNQSSVPKAAGDLTACFSRGFSCLLPRLRVSFIFWQTHLFVLKVVDLFSRFSKCSWCLWEFFRMSHLPNCLKGNSELQGGKRKRGQRPPSSVRNSHTSHRRADHG